MRVSCGRARSVAALALAATAAAVGLPTAAAQTGQPAGPGEVLHEAAPSYPLVFHAQADAVPWSEPRTPEDPPSNMTLGRARLRVGEDVAAYLFRLRVVLEARAHGTAGGTFADNEGGRLSGPLRLTDAFISYVPSAALHLDAGSMRVPFSLSRQIDDADVRFPERAPIIQAVVPDFRTGVGIAGDLGEINYRVGAFAASPTVDDRLFDRGTMLAARIATEPIGPVGLTPWRRSPADAWYPWFRYSIGLSVMFGSRAAGTSAAGIDLQFQWRRLVATAEYIYAKVWSLEQHGAVVEPGVSFARRRLLIVARGDWRRSGDTNEWGAGAAITGVAPDPRCRVQLGFERRTAATLTSGWLIARLIFALD